MGAGAKRSLIKATKLISEPPPPRSDGRRPPPLLLSRFISGGAGRRMEAGTHASFLSLHIAHCHTFALYFLTSKPNVDTASNTLRTILGEGVYSLLFFHCPSLPSIPSLPTVFAHAVN